MESEIEITNTGDTKGWFEKIKNWSYENWQTILVILIVLIIGISAYNYNQENNGEKNLNSTTVINEEAKENYDNENDISKNTEEANQEAKIEKEDQKIATKIDTEENKSTEKTNIVSNSNNHGKEYTVTAKKGEGITHLARRALNQYVQENKIELSQERKIYAEDYIQNRTGNEVIEIGHQEVFSESLMQEAISNANALSKKSIENLKKYIKN